MSSILSSAFALVLSVFVSQSASAQSTSAFQTESAKQSAAQNLVEQFMKRTDLHPGTPAANLQQILQSLKFQRANVIKYSLIDNMGPGLLDVIVSFKSANFASDLTTYTAQIRFQEFTSYSGSAYQVTGFTIDHKSFGPSIRLPRGNEPK